MLYVVVIFGFLAAGTEVFRIIKINTDLEDSLQIILEDSLELAMVDAYRHDHITLMDINDFEDSFFYMLKEKYNLDNNLMPIGESYLVSPFTIRIIEVDKYINRPELKGIIDAQKSMYPNLREPVIRVEGEVQIKPIILSFNTTIPLKFNLYAESKRED